MQPAKAAARAENQRKRRQLYRKRLVAFYKEANPDKLRDVDATLDR